MCNWKTTSFWGGGLKVLEINWDKFPILVFYLLFLPMKPFHDVEWARKSMSFSQINLCSTDVCVAKYLSDLFFRITTMSHVVASVCLDKCPVNVGICRFSLPLFKTLLWRVLARCIWYSCSWVKSFPFFSESSKSLKSNMGKRNWAGRSFTNLKKYLIIWSSSRFLMSWR